MTYELRITDWSSDLYSSGLVTLRPHPWLGRAALAAIVLAFGAEFSRTGSQTQTELFLLAALLHGLRFVGWKFWLTRRIPLLWSLHAGYAWLVVGLILKALAAAGHVPQAAAIQDRKSTRLNSSH